MLLPQIASNYLFFSSMNDQDLVLETSLNESSKQLFSLAIRVIFCGLYIITCAGKGIGSCEQALLTSSRSWEKGFPPRDRAWRRFWVEFAYISFNNVYEMQQHGRPLSCVVVQGWKWLWYIHLGAALWLFRVLCITICVYKPNILNSQNFLTTIDST